MMMSNKLVSLSIVLCAITTFAYPAYVCMQAQLGISEDAVLPRHSEGTMAFTALRDKFGRGTVFP